MNNKNFIGMIITCDLLVRSIISNGEGCDAFSLELYTGNLNELPNDWYISIIKEKTVGTEDNWPEGLYFEVEPHIIIGPKYLVEDKRLYFNIYTRSYKLQNITYSKYLEDQIKKYTLKLNLNGLITSSTSHHKNRFAYVVKVDDQYFIFIKKSIDNDAQILDTIIFTSEEKAKAYIEKLEVQWLD